jgi:hypothetical protein
MRRLRKAIWHFRIWIIQFEVDVHLRADRKALESARRKHQPTKTIIARMRARRNEGLRA